MDNKKKRITVFLLAAILIFSALYVSTFLVRNQNLDNVITFDQLKIQLINHTLENGNEVEVTDSSIKLKRTEVDRIIKMRNVCNQKMFVRIRLDVKGLDNEKKEFDPNPYIILKIANSNWIYSEGWYYYAKVLEPEETTDDLLKSIYFDMNRITADYPGSSIMLDVKAQAVQSTHNSFNVLTVTGWPEEE